MWQDRHEEIEATREAIRQRVRNTRDVSGEIRPAKPKPTISDTSDKKVAVYARVSTMSTDQTSSIENQSMYYEKKIEDTPNWELQEIYSDEGKSGTSLRHRDEFKRMIADAVDKKMDIILCASVSRFARNMSDCMNYIRYLKTANPSHPVGVYFETENIYTLDPDSNQSLSIHAMLADWESANKSRRMILSYDQRICTGQYPVSDLLGYRHTKEGDLVIEPEEAKTVRFIFLAYIGGSSFSEIAKELTEMERPTLQGRTDWNRGMVRGIVTNERRWGDLEARKTIVVDYVEHKSKKNEADRISAYAYAHHEGIVSPEIAAATKKKMESGLAFHGRKVPDTVVIEEGLLKGFINIIPSWTGLDQTGFLQVCRDVYSSKEQEHLDSVSRIQQGKEHSQTVSFYLNGYQVPPGVQFLTRSMPSLTIDKNHILFNKTCHEKLENCDSIEILYHPILRKIAIRACDDDFDGKVSWNTSRNTKISAKGICRVLYEVMGWDNDKKYRLRGITRERGHGKIIFFSLDEPQILINKKKNDTTDLKDLGTNDEVSFGVSYQQAQNDQAMINAITEKDILTTGITVENPNIGHIPTQEEIKEEIQSLLMTM
ncbi:MAG: recombinase family protein [Parasporobacterium sp.]|nr:recombinase family protein [Parasporobacterium sp.]